jgi:hypothetical protein
MAVTTHIAVAAAFVVVFTSTLFADSIDGKHTYRIDRRGPNTERGAPVILFEGRGATTSPLDPSSGDRCTMDEEYGRSTACGAKP